MPERHPRARSAFGSSPRQAPSSTQPINDPRLQRQLCAGSTTGRPRTHTADQRPPPATSVAGSTTGRPRTAHSRSGRGAHVRAPRRSTPRPGPAARPRAPTDRAVVRPAGRPVRRHHDLIATPPPALRPGRGALRGHPLLRPAQRRRSDRPCARTGRAAHNLRAALLRRRSGPRVADLKDDHDHDRTPRRPRHPARAGPVGRAERPRVRQQHRLRRRRHGQRLGDDARLRPPQGQDAKADADHDGLSNLKEYRKHTSRATRTPTTTARTTATRPRRAPTRATPTATTTA